jgi:plastocyanin
MLVVLASCAYGAAHQRRTTAPTVVLNPEPTRGPFVVVAVDNHFHDIHPVDHTAIKKSRALVVKNEGRNLHNFTVVGTGISVDLRPGQSFRWDPIGKYLSPGRYFVICKYHVAEGMVGAFRVTK